ncbi:hypothetical protein ACET3Z_027101 [Daucus carota]
MILCCASLLLTGIVRFQFAGLWNGSVLCRVLCWVSGKSQEQGSFYLPNQDLSLVCTLKIEEEVAKVERVIQLQKNQQDTSGLTIEKKELKLRLQAIEKPTHLQDGVTLW